jgi:hypothetical protein
MGLINRANASRLIYLQRLLTSCWIRAVQFYVSP